MVCLLMLACTGTAFGMEDDSYAYTIAKKSAIGTVAGIAEICANSPLVYFKNTLQQPELKVSINPKVWYRGFGMNVAAMGPTTAVQIGADAGLEAVMPGTDVASKVARAFSAGALSAAVNGPVELVIIDQQKNNRNVPDTIKQLITQGGKRVIMRGWTPTAIREGAFTTGYLVAFPMAQEAIRGIIPSVVTTYLGENAASGIAYISAGAATGLAVATGTHPIDTIKTRMQADYQRIKIGNMIDAMKTIYAERGVAGFFSGVLPRAVRAGLAIPLIGTIKNKLSKATDNQN